MLASLPRLELHEIDPRGHAARSEWHDVIAGTPALVHQEHRLPPVHVIERQADAGLPAQSEDDATLSAKWIGLHAQL